MRGYADHENAHFTWCILAGHFEEVAKLHYHWGGGQSCHFFFFFSRGVCLRSRNISCPVAPGYSRHPRYLSLEHSHKKKRHALTHALSVLERKHDLCVDVRRANTLIDGQLKHTGRCLLVAEGCQALRDAWACPPPVSDQVFDSVW